MDSDSTWIVMVVAVNALARNTVPREINARPETFGPLCKWYTRKVFVRSFFFFRWFMLMQHYIDGLC